MSGTFSRPDKRAIKVLCPLPLELFWRKIESSLDLNAMEALAGLNFSSSCVQFLRAEITGLSQHPWILKILYCCPFCCWVVWFLMHFECCWVMVPHVLHMSLSHDSWCTSNVAESWFLMHFTCPWVMIPDALRMLLSHGSPCTSHVALLWGSWWLSTLLQDTVCHHPFSCEQLNSLKFCFFIFALGVIA